MSERVYEVHGMNSVIYTFAGPLDVRVWVVIPGGDLEEITEDVRRAAELQGKHRE